MTWCRHRRCGRSGSWVRWPRRRLGRGVPDVAVDPAQSLAFRMERSMANCWRTRHSLTMWTMLLASVVARSGGCSRCRRCCQRSPPYGLALPAIVLADVSARQAAKSSCGAKPVDVWRKAHVDPCFSRDVRGGGEPGDRFDQCCACRGGSVTERGGLGVRIPVVASDHLGLFTCGKGDAAVERGAQFVSGRGEEGKRVVERYARGRGAGEFGDCGVDLRQVIFCEPSR